MHVFVFLIQWTFREIIAIYLTLYTFSFEINESRLSGTRCLIQDIVSPQCGDKRMARRYSRRSLPNYFNMTSYHWNVRQNTVTRGAFNIVAARLSYVEKSYWTENSPSRYIALASIKNAFESKMAAKTKFNFVR
jgi:hypothetical protein